MKKIIPVIAILFCAAATYAKPTPDAALEMLMKGNELNERAENEFLDQALTALHDPSGMVCRAAATALNKYAWQQPAQAKKLGKMLQSLEGTDRMEVAALAEEVKLAIETLL